MGIFSQSDDKKRSEKKFDEHASDTKEKKKNESKFIEFNLLPD